jgi:hypothetical protein
MARTAEGRALTFQHRQGQLQIRARALQDFIRIWPLWQGDDRSFNRLVVATVPLVQAHHSISSAFSSAYYDSFRRAEKIGGSAGTPVAAAVDVDRVVASLYVTGQVMTRKAIVAGLSPQAAMQTALVRTGGAMTRHVLTGGRDTILASTREDREARGWSRITSGNACDFCEMLAGRDAVYSADTAEFEAHDHCACAAEPQF